MVVQGPFSLALWNNETQHEFQEHTNDKDGKVLPTPIAEVEPHADYYVQVAIGADLADNATAKWYRVKCQVDGVDVGYTQTIKAGRAEKLGHWKRHQGKETNQALRFETPPYKVANGIPLATTPPELGCVSIQVYEAVKVGTRKRDISDISGNEFAGGGNEIIAINPSAPTKQQKALLRTGQGQAHITQSITDKSKTTTHFKTGQLLASLQLKYASPLGLILAGVLPEPPLWERHRLEFARSHQDEEMDPRLVGLQPTIMVTETKDEFTGHVVAQKRLEKFDLTFLSDAEEEEDQEEDLKQKSSDVMEEETSVVVQDNDDTAAADNNHEEEEEKEEEEEEAAQEEKRNASRGRQSVVLSDDMIASIDRLYQMADKANVTVRHITDLLEKEYHRNFDWPTKFAIKDRLTELTTQYLASGQKQQQQQQQRKVGNDKFVIAAGNNDSNGDVDVVADKKPASSLAAHENKRDASSPGEYLEKGVTKPMAKRGKTGDKAAGKSREFTPRKQAVLSNDVIASMDRLFYYNGNKTLSNFTAALEQQYKITAFDDSTKAAIQDRLDALTAGKANSIYEKANLVAAVDNMYLRSGNKSITGNRCLHALEEQHNVTFDEPAIKEIVRKRLADLGTGKVKPSVGIEAAPYAQGSSSSPAASGNSQGGDPPGEFLY